MIAGKYDLCMDENAGFALTVALTNEDGTVYDLTGFTGESQIRKSYSQEDLDADPLVEFLVTVDGPNGLVTISATATQMTDLGLERPSGDCDTPSVCVWDLFLTPPVNQKFRLLKGQVSIYPQVTS